MHLHINTEDRRRNKGLKTSHVTAGADYSLLPQFCSFGLSSFFWFKYFSCSFAIACYSYKNTVSLEEQRETLELVYWSSGW